MRRTTQGPVGVGAKHNFVRKFLGRRLEADTKYMAYRQDEKVSFRSTSGSAEFAAGYFTEPAEGGTRLTSWIELQRKGFAGLAEPFIAQSLRREIETNLSELKDLLEKDTVTAS